MRNSRKMTNGKLSEVPTDAFTIIINYLNTPQECANLLLNCSTIYSIDKHLTRKDTEHHKLIKIDNFKDFEKVPKWVNINYYIHNTEITDVSALGNVHTLNLSSTGVTDVSALGNVHNLNLRNCQGVTDVSALGNVHTLILRRCNKVTDVLALGNVHTLILRWCQKVTDVSALGNVHTLDLTWCRKVIDISALGNVHNLNLSLCAGVTDVDIKKYLSKVKKLTLPSGIILIR
jgi:hypothetical protein